MGELPNAPIADPHVPQTEGLQIDDHRLSMSCAVVERPDHLCGDELVYLLAEISTIMSRSVLTFAFLSVSHCTGTDVTSYFRSATKRINVFILGHVQVAISR